MEESVPVNALLPLVGGFVEFEYIKVRKERAGRA
jgi:hypothetical protein